MVKTIIQLARETVQFQSKGRCDGDTGSLSDATDQTVRTRQYHSCSFCGHQRNSDFHSKTAETRLVVNQGPVVQRCNSFKNYLCMPPSPSYLSLRTKRSYSLIDNTIWKMRLLAEVGVNNFAFSWIWAMCAAMLWANNMLVFKTYKWKFKNLWFWCLSCRNWRRWIISVLSWQWSLVCRTHRRKMFPKSSNM